MSPHWTGFSSVLVFVNFHQPIHIFPKWSKSTCWEIFLHYPINSIVNSCCSWRILSFIRICVCGHSGVNYDAPDPWLCTPHVGLGFSLSTPIDWGIFCSLTWIHVERGKQALTHASPSHPLSLVFMLLPLCVRRAMLTDSQPSLFGHIPHVLSFARVTP